MAWEVEFTDEFSEWWGSLTENQQDDVAYSVGLLTELGPALGFSAQFEDHRIATFGNAGIANAELWPAPANALRIRPVARRCFVGRRGKTGADRWYETFVALADRLYDELSVNSGKRTNCNACSKLS